MCEVSSMMEVEPNPNPENSNTNASSSFSYNAMPPSQNQTLLNHSATNVLSPSSIRPDNVTGQPQIVLKDKAESNQKQKNANTNVGSSLSSTTDSASPVEIQAPFDFGIPNVLEPDSISPDNVESSQTNPEAQTTDAGSSLPLLTSGKAENLHERCNTGNANILKSAVLSLYYRYTVDNLQNQLMDIDLLALKTRKVRLSSANFYPVPTQAQKHGITDTESALSTEEDFVVAFPMLFDCKDPVSCIASELNPEKIFELVESFKQSGIRTVGDLSRCNSKRLEKIAIVTSPYSSKLQQARLALSNYHSDPQVKTKGEAAYDNSLSAVYQYGFNALRKAALETPQEVLHDNASRCPRPEPVPSPPEVWLYPTKPHIMANAWPEQKPSSTENVAVIQTNPIYGNTSEPRVMGSNYAANASTDSEANDDEDIVCLGVFPKTVQRGCVPSVPELNSAPEIKDELVARIMESEPEVLRLAQREIILPDDSMENFDHDNSFGSFGSEFSDLTMGSSAGIGIKAPNELTTASYSGSDPAEPISPPKVQAEGAVIEKSARDGGGFNVEQLISPLVFGWLDCIEVQMTNEKSAEKFGSSSVPPEDPHGGVNQSRGREVVISVESNFDLLISQNREIGNISNAISEAGPVEMKIGENFLEFSRKYPIDVDEMLKRHLKSLEQLPDLGAKD